MQESLIDQGFSLMLYGMGTVFVFLTILVFATSLMSKIVNRFAPEEQPNTSKKTTNTASEEVNPQILSAIEKAIAAHRNR